MQTLDRIKSLFNTTREIVEVDRKQNSIYLLNLNSLDQEKTEYLIFNTMPEGVSDKYSQRIISEALYGTISPQYVYTGGENKTISFRIKVIEDEHNVDGSIYKLKDRLKRMSEPTYPGGVMTEPLVYFELGDQFHGKGYLTTNISFEGPYRHNRYIVAEIDFNIILIEEYESSSYSLERDETDYKHNPDLSLGADELNQIEGDIDDLIIEFPGNDLELMKDFAFQKIVTKIYGNLADSPITIETIADMYNRKGDGYYGVDMPLHDQGIAAYELWLDYTFIIGSNVLTVDAKLTNLKLLTNKIKEAKQEFYWAKAYQETLDELNKVVQAQIQLYSYMGGAAT